MSCSRSSCLFGHRLFFDSASSVAFVSPRCPSHALLKNALSFFLRRVISDAGAVWDVLQVLPELTVSEVS